MRIRLTFTKMGSAKYTGHLDLHRSCERALRRAGLPLAYSQGFNPRPKIQLAAALPLGFTSECEVADVWLEEPVDAGRIADELARAMPPGMEVRSVEAVEEGLPPLQTQVEAATYRVLVGGDPTDLTERAARLLAARSIPRVRRGKAYDLRPLVESLSIEDQALIMRLAAREGATGRPEEVLAALGLEGRPAAVHRASLHFIDKAG